MKILVIDNYDSFTYNLVQLVTFFLNSGINDSKAQSTISVMRNDQLTLREAEESCYDRIIISPGPGDAACGGVSASVITSLGQSIPVLGVCLGHQIIATVFGASVVKGRVPVHGKTSTIQHHGIDIFADIPTPMTACRYHSLIVDPKTIPDTLQITAWTEDDVVMGIRHKTHPIFGIQFHPESFLTPHGPSIIRNFLFNP